MGNKDIEALWEDIAAIHGDFAASSIRDSLSQAASANAPDELKELLQELSITLGKMSTALPKAEVRRFVKGLDIIIDEATSEKPEIVWWEVWVDVITKAAQNMGQVGKPVLDVFARLVPMLTQKFGPYSEVALREITAETVLGICGLSNTLTEPKNSMVAPNALSIAQAHFSKNAWMQAIYADEAPVGFLMLYDDPETSEYFLWRFMIAEPYHGRGFGRRAIELLIEHVKTRPGAKELGVSCSQGEGSPEGFYLKLGFQHTGEKLGDEVVLSLPL